MTDEELLRLLDEKAPEDLSADELGEIRSRLGRSPALRRAVAGIVNLEEALGGFLDREDLPVDSILRRADAGEGRIRGILRFLVAVTIVLGVATLVVLRSGLLEDAGGPAEPAPELAAAVESVSDTKPGAQGEPETADAPGSESKEAPAGEGPESPERPAAMGHTDPTEPTISSPSAIPPEPASSSASASASTGPTVPELFRREVEAETFARGNAKVDTEDSGAGIGIIYHEEDGPSFLEFDVDLPESGEYRLSTRFATAEERPKKLSINGRVQKEDALRGVTGSWGPEGQRWREEGAFRFEKGRNVIRFEGKKKFPHLDKLRIEEAPKSGAFQLTLEAEDFDRGNVTVDKNEYGAGAGIIRNQGKSPNYAEYTVVLPKEGEYRLETRYAAELPRPVTIIVNGEVAAEDAAREVTGTWFTASQRWFDEGVHSFREGVNTLRIEAPMIPHFDKLRLSAVNSEPSGPVVESGEEPEVSGMPPIEPSGDLQSFEALAREDFGGESVFPTRNRLKYWLEPVGKHKGEFFNRDFRDVRAAGFEGLFRLRSVWRKDAVLRLSLFEHDKLTIHFWTGEEGLTLTYLKDRWSWVAYASRRKGVEVRPTSLELLGTDCERYRRSSEGSIDVRHQDGTLIVTRGHLRLFTLPLRSPPGEIFLEGKATVRGIALLRAEPAPADPVRRLTPAIASLQGPGELAKEVPEGARLERLEGGGVELAVTGTKSQAWSGVVPQDGFLHEYVFEIEGATAGTGIYLGNAAGLPEKRIGFLRDSATGRMALGMLEPWDEGLERKFDPQHQWGPWVGSHLWLRLVWGCGVLKCWTSADGIHWGRALETLRTHVRTPVGSAGIYAFKGEGTRSIRLLRLEVRKLEALESMALSDLVREVRLPEKLDDATFQRWSEFAAASRPKSVGEREWLRAWALQTLSVGTNHDLGVSIVRCLLEEVAEDPRLADRALETIDEVLLLAPDTEQWNLASLAQQIREVHERVGRRFLREGKEGLRPVIEALLDTSFRSEFEFAWIPEGLLRAEASSLANGGRWDELRRVTDELRFLDTPSHPEGLWRDDRRRRWAILDWAESLASRGLPRREGEAMTRRSGGSIVHPLIEELSKEGFNALADFEAALQGGAFRDACQVIVNSPWSASQGLMPDSADPQLITSFSAAVASAFRRLPDFAAELRGEFGPIGRLRIRKAMAESLVSEVEALSLQFGLTDAAVEAQRWLADRDLAAGDFAGAAARYREALEHASEAERPIINSSLRLAGALLGHATGEPATAALEWKGARLEPEAIEALARAARAVEEGGPGSPGAAARAEKAGADPGARVPGLGPSFREPAALKSDVRAWSLWKAEPASKTDKLRDDERDWVGRSLGATLGPGLLLASNRFEAAAYELATGRIRWTQKISDEPMDVLRWPFVAMRPAISGGRVLVRGLGVRLPRLQALDAIRGTPLWRLEGEGHAASDALIDGDSLFVVQAARPQEQVLELELLSLDPRDGSTLARKPLVKFRDIWDRQIPCQAAVSSGKIVVAAGGVTLAADALGRLRWLRKHLYLTHAIDPRSEDQRQDAPIVAGGRVFTTQPGVRAVEAVDLESGQLAWRFPLPDVLGLVGLVDGRLLVLTSDGPLAIDPATGRLLWQVALPRSVDACPTEEGAVLVLRPSPSGLLRATDAAKGNPCPEAVWIDAATGAEKGRLRLEGLRDARPALGPLVAGGGRAWVFYAHEAQRAGQRDLVEIAPR